MPLLALPFDLLLHVNPSSCGRNSSTQNAWKRGFSHENRATRPRKRRQGRGRRRCCCCGAAAVIGVRALTYGEASMPAIVKPYITVTLIQADHTAPGSSAQYVIIVAHPKW